MKELRVTKITTDQDGRIYLHLRDGKLVSVRRVSSYYSALWHRESWNMEGSNFHHLPVNEIEKDISQAF